MESHNLELAELLIAHGADVNALDKTRRTPLYYTWGGSEADRRMAELLRAHGAKG